MAFCRWCSIQIQVLFLYLPRPNIHRWYRIVSVLEIGRIHRHVQYHEFRWISCVPWTLCRRVGRTDQSGWRGVWTMTDDWPMICILLQSFQTAGRPVFSPLIHSRRFRGRQRRPYKRFVASKVKGRRSRLLSYRLLKVGASQRLKWLHKLKRLGPDRRLQFSVGHVQSSDRGGHRCSKFLILRCAQFPENVKFSASPISCRWEKNSPTGWNLGRWQHSCPSPFWHPHLATTLLAPICPCRSSRCGRVPVGW